MELISPIQQLVVGFILIWSGIWKVFIPSSLNTAFRSALSVFLRSNTLVKIFFRLLGIIELSVGVLLIMPPRFVWESYASSLIALGFIVYLLISLKFAPDKPCGCMGSRGKPISWRTLGRAGFLLQLTIFGWYTNQYWYSTLKDHYWLVILAILEVGIFVALSSELDWIWGEILKKPFLRTVLSILYSQPDCATMKVSLPEIFSRLNNSQAYQFYSKLIRSELVEHWRDSCWYFLSYKAEYQERQALIVFSVPVQDNPNWVRAVIVDEKEDQILLQVDPMDIESLKFSPQILNS